MCNAVRLCHIERKQDTSMFPKFVHKNNRKTFLQNTKNKQFEKVQTACFLWNFIKNFFRLTSS